MYFATSPKSLRTQPILFTFFSRPKTVIEDHIRSQFQHPARYIPEHSLDEAVPGIVFWFLCILTKEMDMTNVKI